MQKFTIPGRLEGLNEIIKADRGNRYNGAKLKRDSTAVCAWVIRAAGLQAVRRYPVTICIHWAERDGRRDPDNVASGKKFVLDGLQAAGILCNDGPKQIRGFVDTFGVDGKAPRVEVAIYEDGEVVAGFPE